MSKKERVVIVNPQEQPREVPLAFGPNYVEFQTPYTDLWRAEEGHTRKPIDPSRETVLDIFIENATTNPNKVCLIHTSTPTRPAMFTHLNNNNNNRIALENGRKT